MRDLEGVGRDLGFPQLISIVITPPVDDTDDCNGHFTQSILDSQQTYLAKDNKGKT